MKLHESTFVAEEDQPEQAQPAGILPYQNQQIESASARVLLEVFKMVINQFEEI